MKSVSIFSDPESMAKKIANYWFKQATQAAKKQRIFTVVLSGGSTAKALYPILANPHWKNSIPWKSVHIFFADERCVPPNNEESNYKGALENFINHVSIPEKNIHRIRGEENPRRESLRYSEVIQKHFALK